jgi:hypothetical protein
VRSKNIFCCSHDTTQTFNCTIFRCTNDMLFFSIFLFFYFSILQNKKNKIKPGRKENRSLRFIIHSISLSLLFVVPLQRDYHYRHLPSATVSMHYFFQHNEERTKCASFVQKEKNCSSVIVIVTLFKKK